MDGRDVVETDSTPTGASCATCETCAADKPEPALVVGVIVPQFASLSVQNEYEFERANLDSGGTDREDLVAVLRRRPALARMMCWTMEVGNVEAFHVLPRSDAELSALIDLAEADPSRESIVHVAVGWVGAPRSCGGRTLRVLVAESLYSFNLSEFAQSMAEAINVDEGDRGEVVARIVETFKAVIGTAGNLGLGNVRALIWMALRFAPFYHLVIRSAKNDLVLRSVSVQPGIAAAARSVAEVVVVLEPRGYGPAERYRALIDVSDLFPFPVGPDLERSLQSS